MKKEVWLGKNSLRFWYYRFKDSPYYTLLFISITVLVCIVLLFQVIIPQFAEWFSIRNEVIALQQRIQNLGGNINYMNNVDKGTLESQLQVATSALPAEKNFGTVLNAITDAATQSDVGLEDYSFQVGKIGSPSASTVQGELPSLEMTLVIDGNIDQTKNFIKDIEQKLPLSEVTNIDAEGKSTTVKLQFFQKPFPNFTFNDIEPISPVADSKQLLLQQLASWQGASVANISYPSGSDSAVPLF